MYPHCAGSEVSSKYLSAEETGRTQLPGGPPLTLLTLWGLRKGVLLQDILLMALLRMIMQYEE